MSVPQLPLPIAPRDALHQVILPAWRLLPPAMSTVPAQVLALAIMLQEAGPGPWNHDAPACTIANRWQVVSAARPDKMGPARGLAQFEQGGVRGVMNHQASRYWLQQVCIALKVEWSVAGIWSALAGNDALAACIARLLLFTDPKPLPAANDWATAFDYYLRTWRPGAWTHGSFAQRQKLRDKFRGNHAAALAAQQGP